MENAERARYSLRTTDIMVRTAIMFPSRDIERAFSVPAHPEHPVAKIAPAHTSRRFIRLLLHLPNNSYVRRVFQRYIRYPSKATATQHRTI